MCATQELQIVIIVIVTDINLSVQVLFGNASTNVLGTLTTAELKFSKNQTYIYTATPCEKCGVELKAKQGHYLYLSVNTNIDQGNWSMYMGYMCGAETVSVRGALAYAAQEQISGSMTHGSAGTWRGYLVTCQECNGSSRVMRSWNGARTYNL